MEVSTFRVCAATSPRLAAVGRSGAEKPFPRDRNAKTGNCAG
jgi:hypothetical protein